MNLPPELLKALSEAKDSIDTNSQNRLSLPMRQRIWAAMGPVKRFGIGHKRRAHLAILCARKVLPIWYEAYPDDDGPDIMLAIAEQVIEQQFDPDEASRINDKYSVEILNLNNIVDGKENFRPSAVGDTVTTAMVSALIDDELDDIRDDVDDFDGDPESWECSVHASMAYANDQPVLGLFEADKMREFWHWYIDEAVPQAYETYPDE